MKGVKKLLLIVIYLLFLGVYGQVFGQKSSVHVYAGMVIPGEESIKSGFHTAFGFSYPLAERIIFSFDFTYWKSNVEEDEGKLFNGTLSVTPFTVSLQYTLIKESDITPYVFFGTGFVFTNFKMEDYISIPEVTITQEINNGLSFHFGTGVNLKVTDSLALFTEILYLYRKAKGETTISDMNFGVNSEEFSLNLSSFLFQIGIKYFL